MWASGAVLVLGVAAFLGVFLSRGNSQPAPVASVSSPPSDTSQSARTGGKTVAPSPAAYRVAREFLETAVARKNLDSAYDIVGPALKGGFTRARWDTGNIPVQPFQATNLSTAPFLVKWSYKNQLMLEVGLTAKPGSSVKSLAFYLGVQRIHGKWLVNYFLPNYIVPHLSNPYSN